jgi:hypothetical protein
MIRPPELLRQALELRSSEGEKVKGNLSSILEIYLFQILIILDIV